MGPKFILLPSGQSATPRLSALYFSLSEWENGPVGRSLEVTSSGRPPVQENPICTVYDRQAPSLLGHPCTSTRHPAPPLWTCLPVRKPFFILIQICLLALFPLWPSSALCSNIEQESVGVAWFHFGSLDIVLQDLLPFSPSTAFYLPTAQGLCSPAPSTIL